MPNKSDHLTTALLEGIKQVELSILLDVTMLCDKHDLTYYLIGGTLLGAIRHEGFIPWDDDIDIAMPRKDFEAFQQIAKYELPESLFLHYGTTDPEYYLPIIKIKKNGTIFEEQSASPNVKHQGVFIDIFPLDNAKKNTGFLFHTKGWVLKQLRSFLFLKMNEKTTIHKVAPWKKAVLRMTKSLPSSTLFDILTNLMQSDHDESTPFYVNYGSQYGYKKQTMPKTIYNPTATAKFEGYTFWIPAETRQWLERIYGDNYMELPPIEKRITHKPKRIQLKEEIIS
ncbi:LPS biosynthesis protein [Listeria weihenstephanensis FSL R9-0317]|uniref:LicD/FKTN/FKRP nucleotidyltransferase domain-containing protein n=1 Tax=Listeria weihenstephanensis TaxID=1006155 RepID=A0A1S7FQN8_9LIST|nr:LicD family protein [Listeria weihenstephanensis]AQY49756.1 hypothetical protein UE46_00885 [Listeria weihenstephanensis]EUJ41056.1 LPS biosynthesis protein [Listeria weihenstephanensis FSL R9-0317]